MLLHQAESVGSYILAFGNLDPTVPIMAQDWGNQMQEVQGHTILPNFRNFILLLQKPLLKERPQKAERVAKIVDNSAAMIAATPSTIDINFILAELSREYYGEGYRWFDLVRTQKWAELASSYQIGGSNYGDHTPATVKRTIEPYHYLRPIPQGQIEGMEMTEAEKAAYQNPGYN